MKNPTGLFLLAAACLFLVLPARANDGFYQGSGVSVYPVKNRAARVIRETLTLSPLPEPECHAVQLPSLLYDSKGQVLPSAQAEIGKKIPCKGPLGESLALKWHAKAVYEIEVKQNQSEVQMGFPVPLWSYEFTDNSGLNAIPALSALHFHIRQDGKEITPVRMGKVASDELMRKSFSPWASHKTPAYLWTTNFIAGKTHRLEAEYDFGVDQTAYFSDRQHYPEGTVLWFDKRSQAEVRYGNGWLVGAETILYFLHPLSLWGGPPPEDIWVKVEPPRNGSVFDLVSPTKGLSCVDQDALYFHWENKVPSEDLSVSYPVTLDPKKPFALKPLHEMYEYSAWNASLLPLVEKEGLKHVPMSCRLRKHLASVLGPKSFFASWIKNGFIPCVESCSGAF